MVSRARRVTGDLHPVLLKPRAFHVPLPPTRAVPCGPEVPCGVLWANSASLEVRASVFLALGLGHRA